MSQKVRELCPEIPPAESFEKEIHVQTWEAAAPLCVLRLFPLVTEGRELHVLTDNSAAEAALNSGAIRHEPSMAVVRATFWECKRQNARLRVGWLPGKANIFADAVSRIDEPGQVLRFHTALRYWQSLMFPGSDARGAPWMCGALCRRAVCA